MSSLNTRDRDLEWLAFSFRGKDIDESAKSGLTLFAGNVCAISTLRFITSISVSSLSNSTGDLVWFSHLELKL